jgi:hypothetical protein
MVIYLEQSLMVQWSNGFISHGDVEEPCAASQLQSPQCMSKSWSIPVIGWLAVKKCETQMANNDG